MATALSEISTAVVITGARISGVIIVTTTTFAAAVVTIAAIIGRPRKATAVCVVVAVLVLTALETSATAEIVKAEVSLAPLVPAAVEGG